MAALSQPPRSSRAARLYALLPLVASACGLGLLSYFAPRYLFHQGVPLDDAWIHAVYARELARSGMLAYNPGVAATGETAPLWPLLLAPIHRLAGSVESILVLTKLVGFALHVAACTILGVVLARLDSRRRALAFAAAAIAALHPDLLAASISGMEIPLAELVTAGAVAATVSGSHAALAVSGAAAIGARPELAVMAAVVPALFWARVSARRAATLSGAAALGSLAALVALGLRNRAVSGLFLPATFYAKASTGSPWNAAAQSSGFMGLLGELALVNWVPALAACIACAGFLLVFRPQSAWNRAAAALYLSGALFCAVSFALIPPIDPRAFYHQRYVLPGVAAMVVSVPLLLGAVTGSLARRAGVVVEGVGVAALAALLLIAMPARARHLSNDAQNIDDVQVAFGRALSTAPATDTVWVVDAGASRFFGRPFVVDTIGLNSPALLGDGAQAYLDAHPPAYLDLFPGWSRIESAGLRSMPAIAFEATTAYTVTSAASMRRHILVRCEPPGTTGRYAVRGKRWTFQCSW